MNSLVSLSNSPYYYRNYESDLKCVPDNSSSKIFKRVLTATLPILSFYPPLRSTISVGMGVGRAVSNVESLASACQKNSNIGLQGVRSLLAFASLALSVGFIAAPHIFPSLGLMAGSIDDLIAHAHQIFQGDLSLEGFAGLGRSLLYTSFLYLGSIELLVSFLIAMSAITLIRAVQEFKKERYFESVCHLITSALTMHSLRPQLKILNWKYEKHPQLEGELCRDERGFVYVKIDDEILFDLQKRFPEFELPPYFGEGRAGAHISVMSKGELPADFQISEIGQKIPFTLSYFESLKPMGFSGVKEVAFVGLASPKLGEIREKYGLTPKMNNNHDFHLTFGICPS